MPWTIDSSFVGSLFFAMLANSARRLRKTPRRQSWTLVEGLVKAVLVASPMMEVDYGPHTAAIGFWKASNYRGEQGVETVWR